MPKRTDDPNTGDLFPVDPEPNEEPASTDDAPPDEAPDPEDSSSSDDAPDVTPEPSGSEEPASLLAPTIRSDIPYSHGGKSGSLDGLYGDWFLDYASYVILERAVPHINDGLKPVQRRILHSMNDLEDGRYNKVANIVGHTMKYHPHGDASINDAIVQIGQKELLIDTQGNWGNLLTGDGAAAPRYIEARLTKFALDILFSPKVTEWAASYDGRNKEPVTFPVKFPLVLAQGVEGIAVGLSCRILPHNFLELIDACIASLKGEPFTLYPDFVGGGIADVTDYNDGRRGSRVRVRARLETGERKNELRIIEIPFGTTTGSLMDSIAAANDKGKLKIQKIEDTTAENVEITIHMPPGIDQDKFIQALYAFSDCEVSLAPNAVVINNNRPHFVGVTELIHHCANLTRELHRQELEILLGELQEKWHFGSLEKIFIEKRIYRRIEECETWEAVLDEIAKGLKPYANLFLREITTDDIIRLTEIKIKRISKFDTFQADRAIKDVEKRMAETKKHLKSLTAYTIHWFEELRTKYGKGRERKTELTSFDRVAAAEVIAANETLFYNPLEGFAGYAMKRGEGEPFAKCSPLDDIIVFRPDGVVVVSRVQPKAFIGREPLHFAMFRADEPKWYTLVYLDGKDDRTYGKRFQMGGVTRDREYDLTKGSPGSKVLYFAVHDTEEASNNNSIRIHLKSQPRMRVTEVDVQWKDYPVKGRSAQGNILARTPVKKIVSPAPRTKNV